MNIDHALPLAETYCTQCGDRHRVGFGGVVCLTCVPTLTDVPGTTLLTPLDTVCSVCETRQYQSRGGPVCRNGHGGALGIPIEQPREVRPVRFLVTVQSPLAPEAVKQEITGLFHSYGNPEAVIEHVPDDETPVLGDLELDAIAEAIFWRCRAANVENYAEAEPVIDRTLEKLDLALSETELARLRKKAHIILLFDTEP